MTLEINENKNNNNKVNNSSFSNELNEYINKTSATFSIDRFEGEFAICENKQTGEYINIPISDLPENVNEGSILKLENGKYILDEFQTSKQQEEIKNMVNNLFNKK